MRARARAVADLRPVYPDVVTWACPSTALVLRQMIDPPALRVDGPGVKAGLVGRVLTCYLP